MADITPNIEKKGGLPFPNLKELNVKEIGYEVAKLKRKVDTLGKAVDFVVEELIPKLYPDDTVDRVYENMKKQLDFFMRHLT